MLILRRYFLSCFAREFALICTVCVLMLSLVDQFMIVSVTFSLPWAFMLDMFVLQLPSKLAFVLPFVFFFTCIRVIGSLRHGQAWLMIHSWQKSRQLLGRTYVFFSALMIVSSVFFSLFYVPWMVESTQQVIAQWQKKSSVVEVLARHSMANFNQRNYQWLLVGDVDKKTHNIDDFLSLKMGRYDFDFLNAQHLKQDEVTHMLYFQQGQRVWGDVDSGQLNRISFDTLKLPNQWLGLDNHMPSIIKEENMSTWQMYQQVMMSASHQNNLAKMLYLRLIPPFMILNFAVYFWFGMRRTHEDHWRQFVRESFAILALSVITMVLIRNGLGKAMFTVNAGIFYQWLSIWFLYMMYQLISRLRLKRRC